MPPKLLSGTVVDTIANSGYTFAGKYVQDGDVKYAKLGVGAWMDGSKFIGEFSRTGPKQGISRDESGKETYIQADVKNPGAYLHVTGQLKKRVVGTAKRASKAAAVAELSPLFDVAELRKNVDTKKLHVDIVTHSDTRGSGLVATKPIKDDNIIAYYKLKVFDEKIERPTGSKYTFSIYDKSGRPIEGLIGDLCPESAPATNGKAPYWGYLINEPSKLKDENAWVDINTEQNYKDKNRKIKIGDHVTYKIKSSKDIKAGSEILWCYGKYYKRGYKTECKNKKE